MRLWSARSAARLTHGSKKSDPDDEPPGPGRSRMARVEGRVRSLTPETHRGFDACFPPAARTSAGAARRNALERREGASASSNS
jgi:hypothetical protein